MTKFNLDALNESFPDWRKFLQLKHFYGGSEFGENWFSYLNLYREMVDTFPSGSHFVEIGSWKGKSAVAMAVEIINSGKQIYFDCVDPWYDRVEDESEEYFKNYNTGYDNRVDSLYETFLKNIDPVREYITPMRMTSMEAVELYEDESLDFVFIDGNHEYEYVNEDIQKWLPKIKSGGVLAGHDYSSEPVSLAVENNGLGNLVEMKDECWVHYKPIELAPNQIIYL